MFKSVWRLSQQSQYSQHSQGPRDGRVHGGRVLSLYRKTNDHLLWHSRLQTIFSSQFALMCKQKQNITEKTTCKILIYYFLFYFAQKKKFAVALWLHSIEGPLWLSVDKRVWQSHRDVENRRLLVQKREIISFIVIIIIIIRFKKKKKKRSCCR